MVEEAATEARRHLCFKGRSQEDSNVPMWGLVKKPYGPFDKGFTNISC